MTPPIRAYGDRALLVELADTAAVVAWTAAVRAAELPGVVDIVPAARTVLVVAESAQVVAAVRQAVAGIVPATTAGAPDGPTIEVPVTYDGPDLEHVARLTDLDVDAVVAAHTASPWQVAFTGFAPGFSYLTAGDPRLDVPRRDEARTRVPPGAVGLAGSFSGVYPRESPGGWQLIGHTDLLMWDLDRDPPALLQPGALVQFVVAG
jgi:KipI family sensor histidine kinase inhibitor